MVHLSKSAVSGTADLWVSQLALHCKASANFLMVLNLTVSGGLCRRVTMRGRETPDNSANLDCDKPLNLIIVRRLYEKLSISTFPPITRFWI